LENESHLEVEIKYEASPDLAVPSFEALDGVTTVTVAEEELDAQYFDTADLRLAHAGIGLRRRVGGADEGWHLKLPHVAGTRLELRRPLGRAVRTVPRPLADLVAAHVRDGRLVPVARLQTRRRVHRLVGPSGDVLAEIADDDVHGEAVTGDGLSWRELEAELGAGDRVLLDDIDRELRAAGAVRSEAASKLARVIGLGRRSDRHVRRSSPAGDVVCAYLAEHVAALLAVDPGVRRDVPDAVHKMRVATRRLRSALATYRRMLDSSVTEPVRDELKWLAGVLSPVRDAEVIRDHLRSLVDEQPSALVSGPVRRRIDHSLHAEHQRAHVQALPELRSPRYFRLLDSLDSVAAGTVLDGSRSEQPARKRLPRDVGRTHKRMRRALDVALAAEEPADHDLHELRKAAKRVRYAAESVEPVFGEQADALAKRMERVQDVLGDHQDTVVIRSIVRRLAAEAEAAGEPTFTYGRLHALEEARAERSLAEFRRLVDDGTFDAPSWLG
jgi:CHAD domain-containing protein